MYSSALRGDTEMSKWTVWLMLDGCMYPVGIHKDIDEANDQADKLIQNGGTVYVQEVIY